MSQAIRSFVEDMSNEEHGPRDKLELEGAQQKAPEVQEHVEHAHGAREKPSHDRDKRVEEAVKGPDTEPEKRPRRRREKLAGARPRISRRENERRLEGQLREFERKREAQRKAEEASLVQRKQQSPGGKGEMRCTGREDAKEEKPSAAINMDDQNVDVETAAEILDTHAAHPLAAISDGEHFHPHLVKYSALAVPLAPPSPSITPRDSALPLACSPCENSQTGVQATYLFNPPLRWGMTPTVTLIPVESAQTREDATDVLFDLSLEKTGDSGNPPIPKVKICDTAIDHARGGAYRNARGPQRNRGRRKGGRGPRDKTS